MAKMQLTIEDEKTLVSKVKEFGIETIFNAKELTTMIGVDTMLNGEKVYADGFSVLGDEETLQITFWTYDKETNEFVDRGCERYSEFEEDVYKHLLNEIFTFDE